MTIHRAVGGRVPTFVATGSTPGGYTAGDRFSVAHGCEDFVGAAKTPTTVNIQEVEADPYETQTLTITGTPTGGTFTITYSGQTTAAIAYNAAAADVQAALEALSNIGTGNVACTGGDLPGTAVVIDFSGGDLAGTAPALATTTDSLTGGTTPASAIAVTNTLTTHEVRYVTCDDTYVYLRASGACDVRVETA